MNALRALAAIALSIVAGASNAKDVATAIVVHSATPLRAEPRDSSRQQAMLRPGEAIEVRAERLDYLEVYDHRRERGGFVRATHVRRIELTAERAGDILAIVRFLRDTPGAEALGIGFVAAYIQAASAAALRTEDGADALDALGAFASRLARRASAAGAQAKSADATLSADLDVAARYVVRFVTFESAGRMRLCYDGDAYERLLAIRAPAPHRARAALALTNPDCIDPAMPVTARFALDERRAQLLDAIDTTALPAYLRHRIAIRRASVWSTLAYERARSGSDAGAAAMRAQSELVDVNKRELSDDDRIAYDEAALRVNASRFAGSSAPPTASARALRVATSTRGPGETCLTLVDAAHDGSRTLAMRCTYGLVRQRSFTVNREGTAAAIAVQPSDAWLELWIIRKSARGWIVDVLPPAALTPGVGYAELAGWVPGGKQMLVVREARGEGRAKRAFELRRIDTLAIERQASEPGALAAFRRWQDPEWKRQTVSLR